MLTRNKDGNNKQIVCQHSIQQLDEETHLKMRVDQQLDVICSLKCEVGGREKENELIRTEMEKVESSSSQLKVRLEQEVRAKEVLTDRFETLASNHSEMIELMKEYKRECDQLKRSQRSDREGETGRIREEILRPLKDEIEKKSSETQQLQATISRLEGVNVNLSEEVMELKKSIQTISSREAQLVSEMYMVRQESAARVSLFEEKLEAANKLLDQNRMENNNLQEGIKSLTEEKSKMQLNCLNLEEELGTSKEEVERMKIEVRESNERRQASENRFKTEAEKVSKDLHTSQLRRELDKSREDFSSLESRHQSYKQYTSELLEQERELNKKLRAILS